MVQGVMMCGSFVTKHALNTLATIVVLTLVIGCICLGAGVKAQCYVYSYNHYDTNCYFTKLSLIVNGGVLITFSAIIIVTISVLMGRMREPPLYPLSPDVTQPYTPCQAMQSSCPRQHDSANRPI